MTETALDLDKFAYAGTSRRGVVTYYAGRYELRFNLRTGEAITIYAASGRWSGCAPVPDDAFHAAQLGITPGQHRLVHEIVHHLVGHAYYQSPDGSPVIYRDAHAMEQPQPAAALEEWMVTAVTYHAHGRAYDHGALLDLRDGGVDVDRLSTRVRKLLKYAHAAAA